MFGYSVFDYGAEGSSFWVMVVALGVVGGGLICGCYGGWLLVWFCRCCALLVFCWYVGILWVMLLECCMGAF